MCMTGVLQEQSRSPWPRVALIFTCGGVTGGDVLSETLAEEDVGVDESEQTPVSLVIGNVTRGRTTLGQVLWDLGDW